MKIDPKSNDRFVNILKSVVIPRPIAFISSQSKNGLLNLAPFSFFNAVSYEPPTIIVSIARFADNKPKDTLKNIEETGQFVVNMVSRRLAEAMNKTAAEFPEEINEFEVAGLTTVSSELIAPPRVLESPVNLECQLKKVVTIGEGKKAYGLVVAEVVYCHVKEDFFDGHRVDMQGLGLVGRLGGHSYCEVDNLFEMQAPVYK